jgi:hypothetical protein
VAGTLSSGDSASAVCTGWATWKSSATTSSVGTDIASGDPSRAKMPPRTDGSETVMADSPRAAA